MLLLWFIFPIVGTENQHFFRGNHGEVGSSLFWLFAIYAAFAFVMTLVREITKDIADIEGDTAEKHRTLPILIGAKGAKMFVTLILLPIVGGVAYLGQDLFESSMFARHHLVFLAVGVVIPLLTALVKIIVGKERKHYVSAGNYMKFAMFSTMVFPIYIILILKFQALDAAF
jgi:4-hydroxybenzoate polyprenyltransferase